MSAAGTVSETLARLTRRTATARHLAIPRTTGMPHRPTSSDGQSSVFVFSNPIGRCYRLPKIARRYAGLSLAIGGLGSAAVPTVSHRRRTVRHDPTGFQIPPVPAIAESSCSTLGRGPSRGFMENLRPGVARSGASVRPKIDHRWLRHLDGATAEQGEPRCGDRNQQRQERDHNGGHVSSEYV